MGDSHANPRGSSESKAPTSAARRSLRLDGRAPADMSSLAARLSAALSPAPRPDPLPAAAAAEASLQGVRSYVRSVHKVSHKSPAPLTSSEQVEGSAEVPVSLADVMRLLQQQTMLLQAQGTEIAQLKAARQVTVSVAAVIPPAVPPLSSPVDGANEGEETSIRRDATLRAAIAAMQADPPRSSSPPPLSDHDDDIRSQVSSHHSRSSSRASAVLSGRDSRGRTRSIWFKVAGTPSSLLRPVAGPALTKDEAERLKQLEASNRTTLTALLPFPRIDQFLPWRDHFVHFLTAHHCWAGIDHDLFPAGTHPALQHAAHETAFNHLADALTRGGRASLITELWKRTHDGEALWNAVCLEFASSSRTKNVARHREALNQVIQQDGNDTLTTYIEEFSRRAEALRGIQQCEGREVISDVDLLDLFEGGLNNDHHAFSSILLEVDDLATYKSRVLEMSHVRGFSGAFGTEQLRRGRDPPALRGYLAPAGPASPARSSTADTRTCYTCGKVGHIRSDCPSKPTDGTSVVCSHCSAPGHIKSTCHKLKREQAASASGGASTSGGVSNATPTPGRHQKKKQAAVLRAEIETLRADGVQRAARTHAAHQRTLVAIEAHVTATAAGHLLCFV